MKSKISSEDFFCFLEMISRSVELKMNELTYKKILGKTAGIIDYESITIIKPNINGVNVNFNDDMEYDHVLITAKYIPHTKETFEIEIF